MKKVFTIIFTVYAYTIFILLMFLAVWVYLFSALFFYKKSINILYGYIHFWSVCWLKLTGIKVHIYNRELVQTNQSYIIVVNHTSSADIFPMAYSVHIPYRPLGKIELKNIPVMGFLFSKTLVFVNRKDAESRKDSMVAMKKLLDEHISILIFPEGTRNETSAPLKPFYDGAFRLALETGLPILPVVICNAGATWPLNSYYIYQKDMNVFFLPPINTHSYKEDDLENLKNQTFETMKAVLLNEDDRFKK